MDAGTATPLGKPEKPGVGNIPAPVEVFNIPVGDRNLMLLNQFPERPQDSSGQVSVKGLCELRLPCEIVLGRFHILLGSEQQL
jgi:hypothetical protein